MALRNLVSTPEGLAYSNLFAPVSGATGPSGLADSPRPFVFRANHLNGRSIQPGEPFYFDFNVFSLDTGALFCLIPAFAALAREGLGPRRGKAELKVVRSLLPEQVIYRCGLETIATPEPAVLSLEPAIPVSKIRVDFLTPTELKHDGRIANRPNFSILFGRIRDRISTLRRLYGEGPLKVDHQGSGTRAALVRMTDWEMQKEDISRRSSRTGQVHSIGGFTGHAVYEGDLTEFVPWLQIGRHTGVGRHAVWGNGSFKLETVF